MRSARNEVIPTATAARLSHGCAVAGSRLGAVGSCRGRVLAGRALGRAAARRAGRGAGAAAGPTAAEPTAAEAATGAAAERHQRDALLQRTADRGIGRVE